MSYNVISEDYMRKSIFVTMLAVVLCSCTACASDAWGERIAFEKVKEEIDAEFVAAKEGKYTNLNFVCDEVTLPENNVIQSISFPVINFKRDWTIEEKAKFYKDVIFPKLYGVDEVEACHIVELNSRIELTDEEQIQVEEKYEYDYQYIIDHPDEFEDRLAIGYYDEEKAQYMESFPEGVCINIGQGRLATIGGTTSPFTTGDFEVVKTYDCYVDDLSDSYPLLDGEKTVAEGKEEMEKYLDGIYPLVGEDNGIKNEVYKIVVKKIPNTECYMFSAYRTLSYNGIRVVELERAKFSSEVGIMAEAMMCESNKVDITLGFVNCFKEGTVIKTYEEIIPFSEILEIVSTYLTDEITFDIFYAGLEYRMLTSVVDEQTYYNWTPYWSFQAKNPMDDKIYYITVDMESGMVYSYQK